MHYKRKTNFEKSSVVTYLLSVDAQWRHGLDRLCKQWLVTPWCSVVKNVSGVHCVARGYTNYFHKDVNVSFHHLPSDKQQLLRRWLQSLVPNVGSNSLRVSVIVIVHASRRRLESMRLWKTSSACRNLFFTIRTIARTSRLSTTGHVYIISPCSVNVVEPCSTLSSHW